MNSCVLPFRVGTLEFTALEFEALLVTLAFTRFIDEFPTIAAVINIVET